MIDTAFSVDYHFGLRNAVFSQLELQARRSLYAKRPEIWAKDVLGVTFWSKQIEIAHSVVNNKNTMVAAGHGVGKTMMTAVLMLWWIDIHPIGEAIALSTAPSSSQVRMGIWREMRKLHNASAVRYEEYLKRLKAGESTLGLPSHKLVGYITKDNNWVSDNGEDLAFGRTPPRGREGDSMQGIHGKVLAVADEAVGVSEDMIQTLANNTSTDYDRRLLIANPTNPLSAMGVTWHDPIKSQAWNKISISVFDSPKFTDEWKTLPEETLVNMTDASFVEDKKLEYGEDSANYKARVLGQWAIDGGMLLFPEETIGMGMDTTVIPDQNSPMYFGFDVARSEQGDYSHIYSAQEGWVYQTHRWDEKLGNYVELDKPKRTDKRGVRIRYIDHWRGLPFIPLHDASGRKIKDGANERVDTLARQYGITQLRVDASGMGRSMIDAMHDKANDGAYLLIDMYGNGASPDVHAWRNQRAYQLSELARRMRLGEVDIDPEDQTLIDQLRSVEYKFAAGYANSILIESKEEMRKKGLKSPDAADAAWYAFANIEPMLEGDRDGSIEFDLMDFTPNSHPFYQKGMW